MFLDRKPLSNYGPSFAVLLGATMICLVVLPPLGVMLGMVLVATNLRRRAIVSKRRAAVRAKIVERQRRERILAFKSFPG